MTLRERGHISCEHPAHLVEPNLLEIVPNASGPDVRAYEETHFCRDCGAQLMSEGWRGGSLDFNYERAVQEWGSLKRWWEASGR